MSNIRRIVGCMAVVGLAGCNLNVANPSVLDANGLDPSADGTTIALSGQSLFFLAYQGVALYGGLISEEEWTAAVRLQTSNIASRNFVGTDDINVDFFSPMSIALVSNITWAGDLAGEDSAATDLNLAMLQMDAGYTFELEAETMCASTVSAGPQLSDAQLLDSAITRLTAAVTIADANGANGAAIRNQSYVGLARAYLQLGEYANAITAADSVPSGFEADILTTANASTLATLANQFYLTMAEGQLVVPALYRDLNDPRVPSDSTSCTLTNGTLPCVLQLKYTGYGSNIRLASYLEAEFISAEAQVHASGNTQAALAIIQSERAAGDQPPYTGGTDTLSVMTELLNQRAREFWMEGKKLGDLRRNPSVPLEGVLTDSAGAPFYGIGQAKFGSTLCVPIPPEETGANHNLSAAPAVVVPRGRSILRVH
jgi:starch-binding outer membrane protein, SusD/RagB family